MAVTKVESVYLNIFIFDYALIGGPSKQTPFGDEIK